MANVLASLNDHIRRLARREVRGQAQGARRASAQFRRDIAALKRVVKSLQSRLTDAEEHVRSTTPSIAAPEQASEHIRFRANGLRTHRAKLGLSARDYGKLVGVSALTIYHWEAGKARPRQKQLVGLAIARAMGKREALKRLAESR
ncbi:MAG: helix-turn-helix domain-containing protein [Phycisphaerales bacterium]|nr:helix-turn-helix domain-containing protein [Phycisphaerales bacterium]